MSGSRPEYSRRTFHHGHALHPPAPVHYCPPTRHILDVFNDNIVGKRWGLAALATSSSLCGAAIVLALIFIGDAPHRFGPPFWTLGTIVIAYLICALPISTYTIAVCQRRALGWLGGPTPMTQPQLRATLRLPRTICTVIAALWSIGGIAVSVPAFALLAQPDALSTTATIGLGGLGTIGYTFVFVERAMRPVMAHAVQKMPTGRSEPQLVFEWNTPRHKTDDAIPADRRSFTQTELQTFFDACDDLVDREFAKGSKRWLPLMRDSTAFKVCYAYGLRRRELSMLDYHDFGPNPHVGKYGRYGAVQVRYAKGMSGSGPRRRTVLTVPEFDWVVDLLGHWLSPQGREQFATADRSASLWPSERAGATGIRNFNRTFTTVRELAGLPTELKMHCLRHSYVTHLLEAGYDPMFVQQQVGHAYSSTTALYTSVSADFKQKTIQRMIQQRIVTRDEKDAGKGM